MDEPVEHLPTNTNSSSFQRRVGGLTRKPQPARNLELERLENRFQAVLRRT